MLNVLVRIVFRVGGLVIIRSMMRVASMIGAWELCDGIFENLVVVLASRLWHFLDIYGVELITSVASEARVNNRILRGGMVVMAFGAAIRRREVAVQR